MTPKGGGDDDHVQALHPTDLGGGACAQPIWVPVLMFAFFGLGILAIFLNYTEILPGSPSGWWLIGGLGGHPRGDHHRHPVALTRTGNEGASGQMSTGLR